MKKIIVNEEACIGCGACVGLDGEHFAFNDEGLSHPISQENLDSEELATAIDACPTGAISLKEADGTQENDDDSKDEAECDGCCECCKNEEA